MGGKSSDNGQMIKMQKEQAAEARAKDTARQQRIDAGLAAIQSAFTGKPVTTTQHKTMRATGPGGTLPAGYSYVQTPGAAAPAAAAARSTSGGGIGSNSGREQFTNTGTRGSMEGTARNFTPHSTTNSGATSGGGGGASTWKVRGPDGRMYDVGTDIGYDETVTHGREATGIDDAWYKEYNKGVSDYLLPQVYEQYGDAKDKLTYDFARAGTSRSGAAAGEFADLEKQQVDQVADAYKTADTATGALRSRVADEQAKAQAQLYATENPEVAANQALAAVKNISLDTPAISPLGDVFKTALIGGANMLTGYKAQQNVNNIRTAAAAANKVYN